MTGPKWVSIQASLLLDHLKSALKCVMDLSECIKIATFLWFPSLHFKQPHLCVERDNSYEVRVHVS